MKRTLRSPLLFTGMLAVLLALAAAGVFAENITAPNQYAWGERVGWINFKPGTGPGITVTNTDITGYAWGERIGWVSLSCHNDEPGTSCASRGNWEVTNDGAGNLKGQAWSERDGWISFSCHNDEPGISCASRGNWGVTVNATTGVFSGQAWGERIGWITFNCATTASCGSVAYQVQTGWTAGCSVGVDPDCNGDVDFSNPGPGQPCVQDHAGDANGDGYSDSDELTPAGAPSCTGAFPASGGLGLAGLSSSSISAACPGRPPGSFAASLARADVNLDGAVNALDLNAVGKHFLETWTLPTDFRAELDQNSDGAINALDLNILGKRFLQMVPPC